MPVWRSASPAQQSSNSYRDDYYYRGPYYYGGYPAYSYDDDYYGAYSPRYRYGYRYRSYNGSTAFQRNFRGAASDED